ncbi:MAG: flagellar basal-body MS-ring/collar protein FliF [Candidatus Muiribacteriota bacterium]
MDYKEIIEKVKVNYSNLRKEQKMLIMGLAVLMVFTVFILIFWGGREESTVLFADLEQDDASKIVNELQSMGYTYELEEGGTTILVPHRYKNEIMLDLAGSDVLPEKNVTWEKIFENSSILGQTKQREKIDYIRGLQGEIEYTINQIDSVVNARVHINIPEEKLFKEDEVDATAAVMVQLRPFEEMEVENIRSIQNLVAFSIEGIEPMNVQIVDSNGNILSDKVDHEKDDTSKTMTILQIQSEYEEELSRKARSMLQRVLGPDNADVRISVDFDFDKIETTIEKFAPPIEGEDSGIKRSEEKESESYEGSGRFPGGVPGTDANIPGYHGVESEASEYQRDRMISNYEINSEQKHLIKSPGTVRRLTVSVLLNDDRELSENDKNGLERIVRNAVGFNESRGDQIELVQIHFDRDWLDRMLEEMEAERRRKMILTLVAIGSIVFGLLVVVMIRWYRKYKEAQRLKEQEDEEVEQVVEIEEDFEPIVSIEDQEKRELHERLKRSVQENPEDVAKLLKNWLMEE